MALWLGLSAVLPALAQPAVEITRIAVDAASATISFRDTGTGSTAYRVEFRPDWRDAPGWSRLENAVVAPDGFGGYTATLEPVDPTRGFFRVIGEGGSGGQVPSASFSLGAVSVQEGGQPEVILRFSNRYDGILRYRLSGPGFGRSGELTVAGTEVAVPLPLPDDDAVVGGVRSFVLTVERISGGDVDLGRTTTPVAVEDNDVRWVGTLGSESEPVGFRLDILRDTTGTRAELHGDDTSFFPPGVFAAAETVSTASTFRVRIPGLILPSSAPPLGGGATVERLLEAAAGAQDQVIAEGEIVGSCTWRTMVTDRPYLNTTRILPFALRRLPSPPSGEKLPLTPAQP